MTVNCPVNGGFSPYGPFSPCSSKGIKSRSRTCTNPAPMNGGAYCVGQTIDIKQCPVDGGYTPYGPFSKCGADGTKTRSRTCTNPSPMNGGAICLETALEIVNCPVDGGYGPWGSFDSCSSSCGGGSQKRRRTCNSPSPINGGAACSGPSEESIGCNDDVPCPSNGKWSVWGKWSACSGRCGTGQQTRHRTCSSPAPANCEGSSSKNRVCKHRRRCSSGY